MPNSWRESITTSWADVSLWMSRYLQVWSALYTFSTCSGYSDRPSSDVKSRLSLVRLLTGNMAALELHVDPPARLASSIRALSDPLPDFGLLMNFWNALLISCRELIARNLPLAPGPPTIPTPRLALSLFPLRLLLLL